MYVDQFEKNRAPSPTGGLCIQFEPRRKKTSSGFLTRSDTNQAGQPPKMARGLKGSRAAHLMHDKSSNISFF